MPKAFIYNRGNTKQKLKVKTYITLQCDVVRIKHNTITRVQKNVNNRRELPHTVPDQIQTRSNVCFLLNNIAKIRVKRIRKYQPV